MSKVRLLRLMEYTYDSIELMEADQARWQVQGAYRPNAQVLIRSTVLPLELLPDEPQPRRETMAVCTIHASEAFGRAEGSVSVRHREQSPFGGVLCAICLESFVDNQATRILTADSFKGASS